MYVVCDTALVTADICTSSIVLLRNQLSVLPIQNLTETLRFLLIDYQCGCTNRTTRMQIKTNILLKSKNLSFCCRNITFQIYFLRNPAGDDLTLQLHIRFPTAELIRETIFLPSSIGLCISNFLYCNYNFLMYFVLQLQWKFNIVFQYGSFFQAMLRIRQPWPLLKPYEYIIFIFIY